MSTERIKVNHWSDDEDAVDIRLSETVVLRYVSRPLPYPVLVFGLEPQGRLPASFTKEEAVEAFQKLDDRLREDFTGLHPIND